LVNPGAPSERANDGQNAQDEDALLQAASAAAFLKKETSHKRFGAIFWLKKDYFSRNYFSIFPVRKRVYFISWAALNVIKQRFSDKSVLNCTYRHRFSLFVILFGR
jgi:hypothetical protein